MSKDNYEWKDVTREFTVRLDGGSADGWFVSIDKFTLDRQNISVQLGLSPVTTTSWRANGSDYRLVILEPYHGTFRIERRVEVKPFVFTYTPEFVESLDCKNMSAESVLHHCVLKWDEVIAAHEAGDYHPEIMCGSSTCPACRKYGVHCNDCPLFSPDAACCGNTHCNHKHSPSAANATAVRDYIQGKLDEMRKPTAWVPKVGDRVRTCTPKVDGNIIGFDENDNCIFQYDDKSFEALPTHDLTLIEAAK